MKLVVTGATGFIGTAIVAALHARGDRVTALSRDVERARRVLGAEIDVIAADLETPGAWADALVGADAIVHLAGESIGGTRWDARQKQKLRDSRVEATRTLVEAIAKLAPADRPRALIAASGADYYAFAPARDDFDDDEITEAAPAGETFLGRLCRDWEREAHAADALGVRVVCMRTGVVLGDARDGGALGKMLTPFKLFVGGRIGSGDQWFSWIHRDDAVAAYLAAITDATYRGPINLVAPGVARNVELARAIGAALHRPSFVPVPAFAIKLAVGELADYLLHGRRVVPRVLEQHGFVFARPTLASALADL